MTPTGRSATRKRLLDRRPRIVGKTALGHAAPPSATRLRGAQSALMPSKGQGAKVADLKCPNPRPCECFTLGALRLPLLPELD